MAKITKMAKCTECEDGLIWGYPNSMGVREPEKCEDCNGTGIITNEIEFENGSKIKIVPSDNVARGSGWS